MIAPGECKICEGNHSDGRKCPEQVTPRHLIFEGTEWFTEVLSCLTLLLPLDESLMFKSVGLGEIAPTQVCIQSGRGFCRQGMPGRCQLQELIVTPLRVFGGEVDRHSSLLDLTPDRTFKNIGTRRGQALVGVAFLKNSGRTTWPFHIHNPVRIITGTKKNRVGRA